VVPEPLKLYSHPRGLRLPTGRPFSEIEALYHLESGGGPSSIRQAAKAWGWSRKRVKAFLDWLGAGLDETDRSS